MTLSQYEPRLVAQTEYTPSPLLLCRNHAQWCSQWCSYLPLGRSLYRRLSKEPTASRIAPSFMHTKRTGPSSAQSARNFSNRSLPVKSCDSTQQVVEGWCISNGRGRTALLDKLHAVLWLDRLCPVQSTLTGCAPRGFGPKNQHLRKAANSCHWVQTCVHVKHELHLRCSTSHPLGRNIIARDFSSRFSPT